MREAAALGSGCPAESGSIWVDRNGPHMEGVARSPISDPLEVS